MISHLSHEPQAEYDDDGNIVIHIAIPESAKEPTVDTWTNVDDVREVQVPAPVMRKAEPQEEISWDTTIEDTPVADAVVHEERLEVRSKFQAMSSLMKDAAEESARQVQATAIGSQSFVEELSSSASRTGSKIWGVLTQPVFIRGRGNSMKQRSRGALFAMDVFRFGGTFAGIFAVLFVLLNAQSFSQIAMSKIMPLLEPPSLDTANAMTPLTAAPRGSEDNRGLVAYLPEVGPSENMIIVEKLHIAAPLVSPPTDALLRQDWAQVEKDIQESLSQGVVHYPGTAEPGQAGNFFVTGHSSNYAWAKGHYNSIFARLSELQPGDEYWIYWKGDRHRYIVRSKKVVSPSDVSVLDQPADERLGTLMTCTPVGTSANRLIVQSQEVDPESLEVLKVGEKTARAPVPAAVGMLPF